MTYTLALFLGVPPEMIAGFFMLFAAPVVLAITAWLAKVL